MRLADDRQSAAPERLALLVLLAGDIEAEQVMSGTRAVRAPNGAASRKFEPSIVENTIDPSSSC